MTTRQIGGPLGRLGSNVRISVDSDNPYRAKIILPSDEHKLKLSTGEGLHSLRREIENAYNHEKLHRARDKQKSISPWLVDIAHKLVNA